MDEVLNETFDLFIELGATDEQADFPVIFAVGLEGHAGYTAEDIQPNLTPLFETILKEIPGPTVIPDAPVQLQITSLEYDNYKGQIGVGRLLSGTMRRGMDDCAVNAARRRAQHRQNRLPVHLS